VRDHDDNGVGYDGCQSSAVARSASVRDVGVETTQDCGIRGMLVDPHNFGVAARFKPRDEILFNAGHDDLLQML
jgi:hypothetical protein